jgi:hypothetical protein
MSDEIELLKDVASRLNGAGIEYMMTGSMAMALYSTPRMTRDIDIIAHIPPGDAGKLVALFQKDFYVDETSVRAAIQSRGMFNIIHNETVIKVDFIVRKDDEFRVTEFSRKTDVSVEGVPVSVVSPEDLVLSKLVWAKASGSELQLRDVRQMIVELEDLDSGYVGKWARILGVEEALLKVRTHE